MTTSHASVRFWDRHASGYARKDIADPEAYQQKLAKTRAHLQPNSSLLEFGCGTGSTALLHAPNVAKIHAIDTSGKMIEIARTKAREAAVENVYFEQTTLDQLPDKATYDVVLGLNVIHLMPDWKAALARCRQLLKPGGVFISSTACIKQVNPLLRLLLPMGGSLGLIPRVVFFSHEELVAGIQEAGFTILEDTAFNKNGMTRFIIARV